MFTILPIMAETASPVIAGFVVAVVVILQFLLWHSVLSYGPKISDVFWCFLFSVMICLFGFICYKIAMSETHPKNTQVVGIYVDGVSYDETRTRSDKQRSQYVVRVNTVTYQFGDYFATFPSEYGQSWPKQGTFYQN
jgi:hypothetical protein